MLRKFIFIVMLVALAACGSAVTPAAPTATLTLATPIPAASSTPAGISLTDGLNRTVNLAAPAEHIVSMAPSNTEILFAIGAGLQVVGRDEFSDFPAEAKDLPSVGGSMGQYSLEQIVALKPDLVLASGINTPEQVKALEDLGVKVFYLGNPTTLEEMYANLRIVAQLTGHEADAETLIAALTARVQAVDQKIAVDSKKPIVFYEIDATDPNKPYTSGPGTFIDLLIARAGGVNVGASLKDAYPQVGLEELVVAKPDIILLGDALYGTTADTVKQRPGWETLTAVKTGSIFAFDDNLVSRPGPRLVDGLEQLAKLLHPELYK